MRQLRVWAPNATKVEVEGGAERRVLQAVDGGFHEGSVPWLRPGRGYALRLDEGAAVPDPRAERLPQGVHGPGQLLEHPQYAWRDAGWQPPPMGCGVVYELHVGTFTPEGTFDAARERLDHLCQLGVTHIELMPVHSFAGERGWGYDGVGLWAVHDPYGGPDASARDQLVARVQGVVFGQQYLMLDYDCPRSVLHNATSITPGLESPTIAPLADPDWVAVRALVPRRDVNAIMDELAAIGAKAILASDIRFCRF